MVFLKVMPNQDREVSLDVGTNFGLLLLMKGMTIKL